MRDEGTIVLGDPLSAEVRCERTIRMRQGEWGIRVEAWATMSSTARSVHRHERHRRLRGRGARRGEAVDARDPARSRLTRPGGWLDEDEEPEHHRRAADRGRPSRSRARLRDRLPGLRLGSRTLLGTARRPGSQSEIPHAPQRGHRRGHSARALRPARRRRLRLARRPSLWHIPRFVDEVETVRTSSGSGRSRSTGSHGAACLHWRTRSIIPRSVAALILSNTYACGKDYLLDISDHRVSLGREMHAAMLKHENAGTLDDPEYQDAVAELYADTSTARALRLGPLTRGVRGDRGRVHAGDGARLRTLGPARVHGHRA